MIQRRRVIYAAALLGPVVLLPLLLAPEWALGAALATILVLLAWRSVAYPVVFVGLVPVLIGFVGSNPLPQGLFSYLFFGWTLLAIGFSVLRDDAVPGDLMRAAPVVASLALGGLLIAQLGSSPAQEYGTTKVQLFLSQDLVLLFAGIVIGRNRKHLDLFLGLTLFVAFLSALVLMQDLIGGQPREALPARFALNPEENPIFLGRGAADGLIVAIYLLLAGTVLRDRLYALALLPALAVALVAAGSRGPVVGLICGVTALLVCLVRSPRSRRRIPMLVVAIVAGVVLASQLVPGETIGRSFSILSGSGSGVDTNGRSELWGQALHSIGRHPLLGIGTGGFAAINPQGRYPHNLLLESAVELGVVGLLMALAVISSAFVRLRRAWRRLPEELRAGAAVIMALFVAAVVNSMLSGDITVNTSVWLTVGLALGAADHARHHADRGPP